MEIEIVMNKTKLHSKILIDGKESRAISDIDVDLSGPYPVVHLKVIPEILKIHGDVGLIATTRNRSFLERRVGWWFHRVAWKLRCAIA